jgi:MarC family membrane protein
MSLGSAALMFFLVMDPIGNVPLFLPLLKDFEGARRRRIVFREHLIALAVLLAALFGGSAGMRLLSIEEPALRIGGGLVLLLIAMRMVFQASGGVFGDERRGGEPFVVPLAIPMIAGPGCLATTMMTATQEPARILEWAAALGLAWVGSLVILLASGRIGRALGPSGLTACERLMGMILTLVAVQMLLAGVAAYVKGLSPSG